VSLDILDLTKRIHLIAARSKNNTSAIQSADVLVVGYFEFRSAIASCPFAKIGALNALREDCSIRWIIPFLIPGLIAIADEED